MSSCHALHAAAANLHPRSHPHPANTQHPSNTQHPANIHPTPTPTPTYSLLELSPRPCTRWGCREVIHRQDFFLCSYSSTPSPPSIGSGVSFDSWEWKHTSSVGHVEITSASWSIAPCAGRPSFFCNASIRPFPQQCTALLIQRSFME